MIFDKSDLLQRCQRFSNLRFSSWFMAIAALTIALVLHSCVLSPQTPVLKIGLNSWPGYAPAYYAQSADLFKQRGLDVELVQFTNQQDNIRATMRGALDASFVPLWEVMQADPGDDRPTFAMVADISAGSDGIVARKGIDSIAQLKGKKIGVKLGTVPHLVLLEALQKANVAPQSVDLVDVANDMSRQLIQAGELDAAVIWEPQLSQTAQQIQGKVLFTTADVDSLVIDGLATRSRFFKSNSRLFKQFMLAWFDAVQALENNPDEVFAVIGQQIGQNPATIAADYAGLKKGDSVLNRQMFDQGRLKQAIAQITHLLKADPRHSRVIRQDVQINAGPIIEAISEWNA